jgi:hypothetical protein
MAVDSASYGTVAGVEALVGDIPLNTSTARTFSTTTVPTLAQVESFIDDVADELNSSLDFIGYTVPVVTGDDPYAFGFLARGNNCGAAAMVLDSVPAEAYSVPGDEGPAQGRKNHFESILRRVIKAIEEERISATRATSGSRLSSLKFGSEKDSDGNTKKPFFTRAMSDFPSSRSLVKE